MLMFTVLSSWQSHCESSPGSFDECRHGAKWLPTLRPDQTTQAVSPPVRCHTHHHHLSLLRSLEADTHYTVPQRVEG